MKRLIIACVIALSAVRVDAGCCWLGTVCVNATTPSECPNGYVYRNGVCPTADPTPTPTPTPGTGTGYCYHDGQCFPASGVCIGTPIPAGSPCPPVAGPTPTPTPTLPPAPPAVITEVPIGFPIVSFAYAPDCVAYKQAGDSFFCTPTIGDRIRLYSSPDGVHWFDQGVIFQAACGLWEDDGNGYSGAVDYCTGISNFVVTRSRANGIWIAAYTAGKAPNGAGSGGIGLAWARGDLNRDMKWNRYTGNPILRADSGTLASEGTAFVQRLMRVNVELPQSGTDLKAVQPYPWLYVSSDNTFTPGRLSRIPISDEVGIVTGTLQALPDAMAGYSPLGWDWNGCWGYVGKDWNDASFGAIDIYNKGDCETTKGVLVATIKAADIGYKAIAGLAIIERSPEGGIVGGPTFLLTPWDEWADQVPPVAVRLGPPLAHVPANQPTPAWAQNSNSAKP